MGSNLRNYVIEIRTEIEINATVDEVWRVLTDLEHYEDWNPFIVNASGIIQPGGSIDFETNVPGRDPMKVRDAPITLFDDHREFRWGGSFEH